ncbi:MAG: efflux RND transporter permease subunit, partial [Planctomycetota bacterium]
LIIALGMLVDNAVVVCDNTKRFMEEGLPRETAAARGVEQIMYPTLMGTLTTVGAFAPMAFFLQGARQEYVLSIPLVVSVTLLTSWVLAMTLTTLAAMWVIRPSGDRATTPLGWLAKVMRRGNPGSRGGSGGNAVLDGYAAVLGRLLRVKGAVIAGAAALLVGAGTLPVGSEFFPDDNRDFAYIDVWLPEGSSLARTDRATREVERLIRELSPATDESGAPIERLRQMYTSVGGSGPRFDLGVSPTPPSANFAQIIFQTTDPRLTPGLVEQIRREAAARIAGVRVIPKRIALGPPVESPIAIRVYARGFVDPGFGSEWTLRDVAERVERVFRETEGLWDVHGAWLRRGYQLDVEVDQSRAKVSGVTNASIAETLNAYYSGHLLTTFRDGADQIPVYFRLPPDERSIDEPPQSVFVEGRAGKVPVDTLADTSFRRALTRIERRDQNRMLEVRAQVEPGYLANERLEAARPALDEIEASLPAGVWFENSGTLEKTAESQAEFATAFGVGFVLIVLCLVVQYNSVLKPLIVLTTLPMGLIGALFGLWVTGNAMGFMPILGLVSLAGIVVNSAILYIEFADGMIAERRASRPAERRGAPEGARLYAGLPRDEFRRCLAQAGKLRLPAITLTTATTIGGLIPLALGGGPMWEGMSYLLIFGLLVATVMTLIVLPIIYAFFVEVLRFDPVPAPVEIEDTKTPASTEPAATG